MVRAMLTPLVYRVSAVEFDRINSSGIVTIVLTEPPTFMLDVIKLAAA